MRRLSTILTLTMFFAVGCGGTEDPSSLSSALVPVIHVDMQCDEMAAFFPVSAAIARNLVPPEYALVTTMPTGEALPPGTTLLGVIAQTCSKYDNGAYVATDVRMVHGWIGVEGPFAIDPIPGTVVTLPNMYWYHLFTQTTDARTLLGKRAGLNVELVKSLDISPVYGSDTMGYRTGTVVENNNSTYSWVEYIQRYPVVPIGANNLVSSKISTGGDDLGQENIKCALMNDGQSMVILQPSADSSLGIFGPALQGLAMDWTPMFCGVDVGRNLF